MTLASAAGVMRSVTMYCGALFGGVTGVGGEVSEARDASFDDSSSVSSSCWSSSGLSL